MKTVPTKARVAKVIAAIEDPQRRRERKILLAITGRVTGKKPVLWGGGLVGFGSYSYRRAHGRPYALFRTGFAPRKAALTACVMPGHEYFGPILARLGPDELGKCCLHLKRLADVDPAVLEALVAAGLRRRQPPISVGSLSDRAIETPAGI
jgi:hypothetical protein